MTNSAGPEDQEAAKSALMTVSGNNEIALLKPVLKDGSPAAKKSAIELMAWNKEMNILRKLLPFTSSADEAVKAAAFKALASLAGPDDQDDLINLSHQPTIKNYISDIQAALAQLQEK